MPRRCGAGRCCTYAGDPVNPRGQRLARRGARGGCRGSSHGRSGLWLRRRRAARQPARRPVRPGRLPTLEGLPALPDLIAMRPQPPHAFTGKPMTSDQTLQRLIPIETVDQGLGADHRAWWRRANYLSQGAAVSGGAPSQQCFGDVEGRSASDVVSAGLNATPLMIAAESKKETAIRPRCAVPHVDRWCRAGLAGPLSESPRNVRNGAEGANICRAVLVRAVTAVRCQTPNPV